MAEVDAFTPTDRTARMLAAILTASDDAIIGQDLGGVITSWNPGAERLYGYSANEMVGCSVALLAPDNRRDELQTILHYVKVGRTVDRYTTFQCPGFPRRGRDRPVIPAPGIGHERHNVPMHGSRLVEQRMPSHPQ